MRLRAPAEGLLADGWHMRDNTANREETWDEGETRRADAFPVSTKEIMRRLQGRNGKPDYMMPLANTHQLSVSKG